MSVFDPIRCSNHPTENITIFCSHCDCQTELCASCVALHSDHHIHMNTKPQFQNIKQSIIKSKGKLGKYTELMGDVKERLKKLMDRKQQHKAEISETFKIAKRQIIITIEKVMTEIEQSFYMQLDQQMVKHSISGPQTLQKLYSDLCGCDQEIIQLNNTLLKKFKPGLIKYINKQFVFNAQRLYQEVNRQTVRNQAFKAEPNFHIQQLHNIEVNIKKLMSLSFSIPAKENYSQMRPANRHSIISQSPVKSSFRSPFQSQLNNKAQMYKTDHYGFKQHNVKSSGLELVGRTKQNRGRSPSQFYQTS